MNRLYLIIGLFWISLANTQAQEMREHNGRMMMIIDDTTAIWFDTREPVDRTLFSVVSVKIE
ncbi:MAG: hypothetical protein AAFO91_19255, partial [Bacteroidota bacterium]